MVATMVTWWTATTPVDILPGSGVFGLLLAAAGTHGGQVPQDNLHNALDWLAETYKLRVANCYISLDILLTTKWSNDNGS